MGDNKITLPAWSIAVLVGLLLQLAAGMMAFATLRNDVAHMRASVDETRFRVGNIIDSEAVYRERFARLEARVDELERDR